MATRSFPGVPFILLLGVAMLASDRVAAADLPAFDFRQADDARGWQAQHDIAGLESTVEGLRVEISGPDPFLAGPPVDFPTDVPLWLELALKSDAPGTGQVFYFRDHPTEPDSVRFAVRAGEWTSVRLRLPPLGSGWRLRLDPPGQDGVCLYRSLTFHERVLFPAPAWPEVALPDLGDDPVELVSGGLRLRHARDRFNAFHVEVEGRFMACGNPAALLGYAVDGGARWTPLATGADVRTRVILQPRTRLADRWIGGVLRTTANFRDPDGVAWEVQQDFTPDQPGTLRVAVRIQPETPREVLYLPVFTLFAGLESFGTNKTQALLPGIEYLANEPGSSTADLNPPASNRQVPDLAKLTFPLMAIAAGDRWLGLTWTGGPDARTGVVFDSPDRFFHSGGHLLGVLFPGSDGANREEDSLLPYAPERLRGSLRWEGLLMGGTGRTVVPAVQRYVALNGFPALPEPGIRREAYHRLAARGWLDSELRDGNRYRHAAGMDFPAGPAADAAVWMEWLAGRTADAALAARLRTAAAQALVGIPAAERNGAQAGHIRYPLPALAFGEVRPAARQAARHARALLDRFEADGSIRYRPVAGRLDFGRTHWSTEANGLTAQIVRVLLEEASFCGEEALVAAAVERLRGLDKFRDTVPRGAQTWEIPLHTPDILASANLVAAYVRGYELTGEPGFLEQARYWAWTGVPFVYLTQPVNGAVGRYSTIAVLGATIWVAPVWIGLPVQWCGLVYADALNRLARYDPETDWRRLAVGIALAGIQHLYPANDPRYPGLLPDSFALRAQVRNGPAINPATLLVPAIPALGEATPYDFIVSRRHAWRVHAPGAVHDFTEDTDGVRFTFEGWRQEGGFLFVNGLRGKVSVRLNDRPAAYEALDYEADAGWLVIKIAGTAPVRVELLARPQADRNAG
ncbi:MAG: hypothetical protein H7A45_07390 [Verrucomicrobiales bacterium]|nr:hypothetical protein [Verrucomicrobiales bacterium]MCP5528281.1 hypothetical protein [Verrucomicrobiales bacterium]